MKWDSTCGCAGDPACLHSTGSELVMDAQEINKPFLSLFYYFLFSQLRVILYVYWPSYKGRLVGRLGGNSERGEEKNSQCQFCSFLR